MIAEKSVIADGELFRHVREQRIQRDDKPCQQARKHANRDDLQAPARKIFEKTTLTFHVPLL